MRLERERTIGLSLGQLFPECHFAPESSQGVPTDITLDSRCVTKGGLFVALRGESVNREVFVESALVDGALAAVKEGAHFAVEDSAEGIVICVPDLRRYLAELLVRFFGDASASLTLVGITGTNGKTSCADYLLQLWFKQGKSAASLGTLGWRLGGGEYNATGLTTLDVVENHRMMSRFIASGVTHVVMEVSSHGIAQGRIAGLKFDATALSNITRDHLDYHGSFETYAQTKLSFLGGADSCIAVNVDDSQGAHYAQTYKSNTALVAFSLRDTQAQVYCENIHCDVAGTQMQLVVASQTYDLSVPVIGLFNASNVLLVVSVLVGLGEAADGFIPHLHTIQSAPGRLENIQNVFIDYAHTPDALENALAALKPHCQNRLLLVFGCGGDRDSGKRELMAQVAERHADLTFVTSDNPRSEDPGKIVGDIVAGFKHANSYRVELDRATAISMAIREAEQNDVVLVAGKGHEDYQEINGQRYPFSDVEEVKRWVA